MSDEQRMRVTVQFDVIATSTAEAIATAVGRLDAPDECLVTVGDGQAGPFYRGGTWRDEVRRITALRSLPVAERMEAMGMEKASGATVAGTTLDFYFQRPC